MNQHLQTLWALAVAEYPTVDAQDFHAVHLTYGPAFGPWRAVEVVAGEKPVATLAAGGALTDVPAALRRVAADWRDLTESDLSGSLPACPDAPTAGDVALQAPHGLLVHRGLVRLAGEAPGTRVPADLPLAIGKAAS
ncbi:hypothetical protein [Geodermatophilus sp. SYSU D01119]